MTTQPITRRRIWALAVPIILSGVTVPLLGVVDTAVVGHLDSAHYLGAVSVGALIISFVFWSFGFLRQGTTGPVAQGYGAGDGEEVRAILGRALVIALIGGAAMVALQVPIKLIGLGLIDPSEAVREEAALYISIRIWAAPGALIQYVALGWLVGMHDTKSVLAVQVVVNGINIILDLLFVLGFGWAVAGVAIATLIAELGGAVFALWLVSRRLNLFPGRWVMEKVKDRAAINRLMGINRDIMIRGFFLQGAFFIFTAQAAAHGDVVLAANAVLLNLLTIAAFALDGFAHAAEALVGGSVGRRDRQEFDRAVRLSCELAFGISLFIVAVYGIFGGMIIDGLTGLEPVREAAREFLPWLILAPAISVWSYQMDGIYFGATATREVRNMMVLCFAIYIGCVFAFQPLWDNHGLWAALMLFNGLRGLTLALSLGKVRARSTAPVS